MTELRKALVAAFFKSLLRGKTLLQAMLSYLIASPALQEPKGRAVPASLERSESSSTVVSTRSTDDFLAEAEDLLLGSIHHDGLLELAAGLKAQFQDGLRARMECMLPSYNHLLATGHEAGQYLALDVGGSTLRVALVELTPAADGENRSSTSEIVRMMNFRIDSEVKSLVGMAFFNWMADRILDTISQGLKQDHSPSRPMPLSLAWSFPIEQTSLKGGRIQGMGKGFLAADGLLGQDLGEVIQFACRNKDLNVELRAILNDSSAALLAQSYSLPSTRFGLILGTGVNIAAYLPISTMATAKFGERPATWMAAAGRVIVNTELGMFGRDILPLTRWDRELKAGHARPDFQPLEHLVSGFYLGEVCRFALIEGIEEAGLFGGEVPPSLREPYALDTETMSLIEGDTSVDLEKACIAFSVRHPSDVKPTTADMMALRSLASFISQRSSAIVATCVYSLWDLRIEAEIEIAKSLPTATPAQRQAVAEAELSRTIVAFNGSVIESYPGYLAKCQNYINDMVASRVTSPGTIDLVAAKESSLLGAAVAIACVEEAE